MAVIYNWERDPDIRWWAGEPKKKEMRWARSRAEVVRTGWLIFVISTCQILAVLKLYGVT